VDSQCTEACGTVLKRSSVGLSMDTGYPTDVSLMCHKGKAMKVWGRAGHWWLKLVILAAWEAEIVKMVI
jgi:hypothetical protein